MPDLTKRRMPQGNDTLAPWSSKIESACKESGRLFLEHVYCMSAWKGWWVKRKGRKESRQAPQLANDSRVASASISLESCAPISKPRLLTTSY